MMSQSASGARQKIPFGLKDGRLHYVLDVPGKSACGCVCPGCGAALVAVNGPDRQVVEHFRHKAAVECVGALETALHRAAKQVLLDELRTALPAVKETLSVTTSDGAVLTEAVSLPSVVVVASSGREEVGLEGCRPDVVFEVDGHQLNIEVRVTHAVDAEKQARVEASGIATLEIDLSRVDLGEIRNMPTFVTLVCEAVPRRQWIYSPRLERARARARTRLEERRGAHEAELARQREEEDARALQHQRRVLDRQQARAARRAQHPEAMALLAQAMDADWLARRARQWPRQTRYALQQGVGDEVPDKLFAEVPGDWIMEAHSADWQAFVLDTLFPAVPTSEPVTPGTLTSRVVAHFGILAGVQAVVTLETAQRLHPHDEQHDILMPEELRKVRSPLDVVTAYLAHLHRLGLVTTSMTAIQVSRLTLARALPRAVVRAQREEHALAIRASAHAVHALGENRGYRCSVCYLMSVPGDGFCPYCGRGRPSERSLVLDAEMLRRQRFKLRSDPVFYQCLSERPELDLAPLADWMARLHSEEVADWMPRPRSDKASS